MILIKIIPIIKLLEFLNEDLKVLITGLPFVIALIYDAENKIVIGKIIKSARDFKNLPTNGISAKVIHTDVSNTIPNIIENKTSTKTHFKIFKLSNFLWLT